MFRTDLLSIIRSLNTVYTAIGICHASYGGCLLARSGWKSILKHDQPKSVPNTPVTLCAMQKGTFQTPVSMVFFLKIFTKSKSWEGTGTNIMKVLGPQQTFPVSI